MNRNLKLVINNSIKKYEEKFFFEKAELKIILDLFFFASIEDDYHFDLYIYEYVHNVLTCSFKF